MFIPVASCALLLLSPKKAKTSKEETITVVKNLIK